MYLLSHKETTMLKTLMAYPKIEVSLCVRISGSKQTPSNASAYELRKRSVIDQKKKTVDQMIFKKIFRKRQPTQLFEHCITEPLDFLWPLKGH